MLNYSIMRLDEAHLEEYCQDIAYQVKHGIATMPLFNITLTPEGIPAIDKAELCCRVYERYKARLDELSIPSGVLIQASIGHGWKLNAPSAFQKYVGLSDGSVPEICCPLDEDFREYIRRAAARIAATKPAHIMLDDDFRLMARSQKGCACPLHLEEFRRRTGVSLSREELYGEICRKNARYREIFIQTQIDSLIGCAKEIRRGIDSVDPTIPGSFCLCGNSAEGAYEIASIMAGEGNPITLRLNNANYCAEDPRNFAQIMHRAASQIAALGKRPDVLLAETDTCPQNRYSTPAAKLHSHFTFTILEGAKGAKHWITRSNFEPNSGVAYRRKLEKNRAFYEALSEMTDGLTWLGCRIPVSPVPFYSLTPEDEQVIGNGWYSHVLDRFGLPMHFSPKGEGAVFFDGSRDDYFTDEEMLEILSGVTVFDGPAAEHAVKRGLGKYLGVDVKSREPGAPNTSGEILYSLGECGSQPRAREIIPLSDTVKRYSDIYHLRDGVYKDVLFPGVTAYRNELGGTAIVFAGDSCFKYSLTDAFGMLNETRKGLLIRILSDCGCLPIYCPDDAEILLKAAKREDGGLLCAVLDMSLDPIENLPLVTDYDVKSIRRLNSDGKFEGVSFQKDGNRYTLDLTAGVFDPVILLID